MPDKVCAVGLDLASIGVFVHLFVGIIIIIYFFFYTFLYISYTKIVHKYKIAGKYKNLRATQNFDWLVQPASEKKGNGKRVMKLFFMVFIS